MPRGFFPNLGSHGCESSGAGDARHVELDLERIVFAGIPLPASVVAAMVEGKDTSRLLPPGFRLGEPFPLPYDLESIRPQPGAVSLRQRPTAPSK